MGQVPTTGKPALTVTAGHEVRSFEDAYYGRM